MAASEAIQATLSPVFLITGAGIFLNFIQGRLFRVVDHIRALAEEARNAEETSRERLLAQKGLLIRRGHLLRNAIALGVAAVALTVLTAALLLASALYSPLPDGLVLAVFALALFAFLGSLGHALADTFLSVRAVREEVVESVGPGL